ncbi:MAG: FCD domain-containing protein [Caldilineaceae bacterium]
MVKAHIDSEFLQYLLVHEARPGERLPSLTEISAEIGVSVGKLREQFEVVRTLGLVEASPRRGITRMCYDFLPPVRLSLLTALALDHRHFDAFSSLRVHLETAYWDEAVQMLTDKEKAHLQQLVEDAMQQLHQPRIQIPHANHRDLHLTIFSRLENPFVNGLLKAYWDAYEAVELNTYADYVYLLKVWQYHDRIVQSICEGEFAEGKQLLIEHMGLLSNRGISLEAREVQI